MRRIFSSFLVILAMALGASAQTAPDATELTKLLKDFLDGASRNDAAIHDRFWAEDLIYTGSGGRRRNKADVMRDVRSAPAPKPEDPKTTYTAEDVRIQQYGQTAIVAFRLVGTTDKGGTIQVANYLNTGTFLKRSGKWQVVSWQATRVPRSDGDSQKEVAAAEGGFHQALLAADLGKLESLLDETFIWTHDTGQQKTRQQLLDDVRSGRLKYSKLETNNVKVSIYGDTGVVRGVSPRQYSVNSGANGSADTTPFTIFYTLTFVNRSGDWKVVAMHSSKP
ncbi:MAG: nuclear transport factor 2 family protein [Acidobacteriota bacterium]